MNLIIILVKLMLALAIAQAGPNTYYLPLVVGSPITSEQQCGVQCFDK